MPRDDRVSTKPLLDKLGVKPGFRVAVIGLDDEGFLAELEDRTKDVSTAKPKRDSDLVFLGVTGPPGLRRLSGLQRWIKQDGAIWAVWPKGRREFRESDVIAGALSAGLVAVKVVKFSETHSALKLVIPVARRRRG